MKPIIRPSGSGISIQAQIHAHMLTGYIIDTGTDTNAGTNIDTNAGPTGIQAQIKHIGAKPWKNQNSEVHMTRLYITRHVETIWYTQKRMQGRKDSPLTEKGKQQAVLLSKALADVELEAIYSSSSGRTMQTARIIAGSRNIPIIPLDSLREINLGEWEGMNTAEAEKQYPEQYRNFWKFPHLYEPVGGESFGDLISRIGETLELLANRHNGKSIMVVTHAVILKTIALIVEKKELKDLWSGAFMYPTSLSIIERGGDGWKAVKWGDISHYEE